MTSPTKDLSEVPPADGPIGTGRSSMRRLMGLYHSTHRAKVHARAHVLPRKRAAPLSVDGEPRVRTPPHDGVTLLRAVICLSIVIAHLQPGGATSWPPFLPFQPTAGWLVTHPRLGFESFFVLAGYFLAHNFRPGPWRTFSVSGFYRRRLARLLLPYWLILIVSWVAWVVSAARHHAAATWLPPGFWRQVFLMHNLEVNDLVAPQLWFMAPLIQFYLGWGVVFWLGRKAWIGMGSRDGHRAAIQGMMALMAVVFLGSIYMDAYRGGLDYTLSTNAHYLALGCLVYWYGNGRVGIAWLLCALGMEVAHGLATDESRPVAAVVTGLVLVWSAERAFSAGPRLKWLLAVGRCSYSIYLTHLFVGWRVMALFAFLLGSGANSRTADTVGWMVAVTGCALFGYGYYRLVEQPCARWARTIEYRYSTDISRNHGIKGTGISTD